MPCEQPTVALAEELRLTLTVPAGSEADLTFVVAGQSIALGRVLAVDPADLDDLDVVVGYGHEVVDDAPDLHVPFGVRAVLRDRDGDLVYGAPVTWEVEDGAFPILAIEDWADETIDRVGEYVVLYDYASETSPVCFAPPLLGTSEYAGRVVARHAGLSAAAEFTWTVSADSVDAQGDPSPRCEGPGFAPGACGCTSTPRSGDAIVVAVTLLLVGSRRRRRGDPPASISPAPRPGP